MILLFFTLLKIGVCMLLLQSRPEDQTRAVAKCVYTFPSATTGFSNSPTCPIVLLSYPSADLTSLDFNNIMTFMPRNVS